MFDPDRIRAICFDFGGTLDADGVPWKERFYPLYLRHGVRVDRADFDRAFYYSDDTLTEEGNPALTFREVVFEQVRRVLARLDLRDRALGDRIAEDFLASSLEQIERNRPVLARLTRRRRLGLISNNYGNLRRICDDTGLAPLFSAVVDSRTVGFTKPDRRIFECALKALGVEAEAAIMVGDSVPRDVGGAKVAGMHAILLSPRAEEPCREADRTIRSLEELLEVVPS